MRASSFILWQRLCDRGVSLYMGCDPSTKQWGGQVKPYTQNLHEIVRGNTAEEVIEGAAEIAIEQEWVDADILSNTGPPR